MGWVRGPQAIPLAPTPGVPSMTDYSSIEQRVVDHLRLFLGDEATQAYERCGRSLLKLSSLARESTHSSYRLLAAGLALAQETLAEPMRVATVFDTPAAVKDYLRLHFAGQAYESFVVLFLDAQHQLLTAKDLFRGTLTQTSVYPREVLREALNVGAGAVILAHNHPSGVPEPSRADEVLTTTMKEALALVDVRVLDHIVVAGTRTVSFAERGLV
ncbi:MAG: DNA repair protein RadC [Proteobacteria bacterium]|nr:DNA repair protein RadC [Pseudomonadota bacterium]MDN4592234.1 DNA repair protein RadC [Xenophilus aerolatus]